VFHERRARGKTVVLVTHDMSTVQSMCDRALLLDDGQIKYIGDPDQTALRYYRMNFARPARDPGER
jgi:ABC-2 type transport system ATP-binding protein